MTLWVDIINSYLVHTISYFFGSKVFLLWKPYIFTNFWGGTLEPDPISGVVKGFKVICQPKELKEYGEWVKIVVVSEKLFSKLMSSLFEMEYDLLKLKELNVDQTIKNIDEVRGKIKNHIKELSYSEYMDD